MSSADDEKQFPTKVIVRRRPAGTPPAVKEPEPNPWDRFDNRDNYNDDRPKTGHDLYLTYDIKGKLRTHTVYHSPVDPRTIVPRPGKKKKAPAPETTQPHTPSENSPTENP